MEVKEVPPADGQRRTPFNPGCGPVAVTWSGPFSELVTLFIGERTHNDDNEVNKRPDAQPTQGHNHQNASTDFADVETVRTEHSKEKAEQESRQNSFIAHH